MKNIFAVLCAAFTLASCTSIKIDSVSATHDIQHICIEKNVTVMVDGFVSAVINGIQSKGISTEVYDDKIPDNCTYRLTYSALQSWDYSMFLSHAEIYLYDGVARIGSAEYHIESKGGISFTKWASVESKMAPVLEQLLANL